MKQIFEPVKLNHIELKNRLIRSATWEGIANQDGSVTEEAYEIYEELAKGGIGAIITGFTSVALHDYYFGGMMRLCDDALIPQYKRLTDIIHAEGIPLYCKRLAQIYKSEESIGGLPINMDGFRLFDKEHRSSKPLNLAYKAAQISDAEKADAFLIALRHATVIDCLPTTHFDIIMRIVRQTGIDEESFIRHYQDGSAESALNEDLACAGCLGIHSLPAYLLQYKGKALLMQSFDYQDFSDAIKSVMQ